MPLDVEAVGTSFVVTLPDGRVIHSPDLVGVVLVIASGDSAMQLRIDDVERDPSDKRSDIAVDEAVWLHTMSEQNADGTWHNLCAPGPDGRRQGFPLAGQSMPDGTMQAAPHGVFELVCSAGAQGKCVRFGYHPWAVAPDGSALRPAYNACVHMVRGDYAGDNSPKTRNGMLIDVYDDWRIQEPDAGSTLEFEAGWSEQGAVCVHHPRVRENVTLDVLEVVVPALSGRTGAVCTEAFARAHGALIYNRSVR